MYDNGRGVPQDYQQAYAWYAVAAANGDNNAPKNRENVARRLTPLALTEAQTFARNYFARFSSKK
ncbi:hypothetical protein B4923_17985 [Brenneria roseae subsp. americana]|uniref:Sel1 repeat family protein n=1 Tax=Brenneria roseae subsp. americana TaxID=1508507 RepID=A0A2U1TKS6_9GAMM|nr:hypothetical protein B4923_17985 [Brenneria roseae subsp. americana]